MNIVEKNDRCTKCILPKSFPGIHFNENGVCHLCSSFQHIKPLGEQQLRQSLSNSNNSPYDCVVLLSGGKDSTYALYYAVRVMGLKVVAANYDSGFQSELAMKNMLRTCEALKVPFIIKRIPRGQKAKLIRRLLHIADTIASPLSLCANCENGIRSAGRYAARKYAVGAILSGQTNFERFALNPVTGNKYLVDKLVKGQWSSVFPQVLHAGLLVAAERTCLNRPLNLKPKIGRNGVHPKTVHLFDFIPWTCLQPEIAELLTKEVEWEYPRERVDRFDCVLHPFLNYKWYYDTGITWDGYLYSVSIRMGTMSREKALKQEKRISSRLKEQCLALTQYNEFKNISMSWLSS